MTKLIGITYPKAGVQYHRRNDDVATAIMNDTDIKSSIMNSLFNQHHDAVLLNYGGKLYVCEKLDNTYTKREVIYHPLASLVS